MVEQVTIKDIEKHEKWSDRWINARYVWWAKICKKKMDGLVVFDREWILVDPV